MKKKNILVLATLDERGTGHGWSQAKLYENKGYNVDFICLIRNYSDTKNYIIDGTKRHSIKYLYYKFFRLVGQLLFAPYGDMRWYYKGYDFANANDILKRLTRVPDYVIICTHQYFLSPKTIQKLYEATQATFIFIMVDEKLLGGGCAYPLECREYENGCRNCPRYRYAKFIPRYVVRQKEKYLSPIPFHVVGTSYDLNKTKSVLYLKDKKKYPIVGVPTIPFRQTKAEARSSLGIPSDNFVMMAGAKNIKNPIKGFKEMMESIALFSKGINEDKKITLLLSGNNILEYKIPDNIQVVTLGFLSLDELFTAYYACDVYLSPSLYDSGPYMVNYALACGRPVIAFPVGVALDLVVHGTTGWLATWKNTKEFSEGILYFYQKNQVELAQIETECVNHILSYKKSLLDEIAKAE